MRRFLTKVGENIPLTPFNKGELLVFLIICFLTLSINAQSLSNLELNYQIHIQQLQTEQKTLDSLNTVHNTKIAAIEKEKNLENKNKIADMLAEAVVVSNLIKEQQEKIDTTETKLDQIKKKLNQAYTEKIDSLKILKASKSYFSNREQLQSQIMTLIEKRLHVAPRIHTLSFNPQKLIQYRPSQSRDSLQQNIYKEYLTNALKETEEQSQQLALLIEEIEDIVNLQNETKDFIEDVNSEIMFNPAFQSTQQVEKNDNVFLGGTSNRLDEDISNIYSQANSYLYIFNQLRTTTTIDAQSSWKTPTDTIPANLTFNQYLNLLKDIDKMLQDYHTLLQHKMESN